MWLHGKMVWFSLFAMDTGTMSERGLSGAIVNKIVPRKMDTPNKTENLDCSERDTKRCRDKHKKNTSSNRNSIHNLRTFISLYDLLRALNHSVRVQSASPIITQTRGEQTDRRTTANYCSEFSLIHYVAFINLDGCSSAAAAAAVATASNCKKQDRKANSCDSHLASLCFLSRFRLSARLQYLRFNLERDPVVSRPSHQCRTPGRS